MRAQFGRIGGVGVGLLWTVGLGGCGRAVLSMDDVIVGPDETVVVTAHLMRMSVAGIHKSLEHRPIHFFVNGQRVDDAVTGDEGFASVVYDLKDVSAPRIGATVQVGDEVVRAEARLFRWSRERTVIIVDIDGTISRTDYKDVIFDQEDDDSRPMPMSRQTLTAWAEDFDIAYQTVRPQFLLDKTRHWLEAHGYPRGPVFVAPNVEEGMMQRRYKTAAIRRLRQSWPNILIGIGNSSGDAYAYGANDMLTVIVGREPDGDFGNHAFVLKNWEKLERFFAANRAVFTSPEKLAKVIEESGNVQIPLTRFSPD